MLLSEAWITRLLTYRRLIVGFSGGLDSSVLLHLLAHVPSLRDKLCVVHVHHGLSPHASQWQKHCEDVCRALHVACIVECVTLDAHANLEEKARDARYQAFAAHLEKDDALLVAHHADDQVETVFLHLMRGTGLDGLAAMLPMTSLQRGVLLRPLLDHPREALLAYAQTHALLWIEDESNENRAFSRNYLRHEVLPLLHAKWPHMSARVLACAQHCQQAQENLDTLAALDGQNLNQPTLSCALLTTLPHARCVNVLRVWMKKNQVRALSVKQLEQLMQTVVLARADATPCFQSEEIMIRRYQQILYLTRVPRTAVRACTKTTVSGVWTQFPAPHRLDDHDRFLHAKPALSGLHIPPGTSLRVAFREGGERISWRGHTRELKKLFQEWRIAPWLRDHIPLIYRDDELVMVIGFAVADHAHLHNIPDLYELSLCQTH